MRVHLHVLLRAVARSRCSPLLPRLPDRSVVWVSNIDNTDIIVLLPGFPRLMPRFRFQRRDFTLYSFCPMPTQLPFCYRNSRGPPCDGPRLGIVLRCVVTQLRGQNLLCAAGGFLSGLERGFGGFVIGI